MLQSPYKNFEHGTLFITMKGVTLVESKASEFDRIAEEAFFPIYAKIAEQIIEKTEITKGLCLDIGCGGGHLGLSLAKASDMEVVLLDIREDAQKIAENRIKEWGLENKAKTLLGDVHNIMLEDGSMDLVISRGSIWFWEDQVKAFKEIYRVLRKGGMAYVGGGFGNSELRKQVDINMKKIDPEWPKQRQKAVSDNDANKFEKIMKGAALTEFEIIDDERGIWAIFRK
jgi:ubiquinone/menaquinone biosynthesis C-methylase UbiE